MHCYILIEVTEEYLDKIHSPFKNNSSKTEV